MSLKSRKEKRTKKSWTQTDFQLAISAIDSGTSIRKAARQYGMTDGILRYKLKQRSEGSVVNNTGRPTILSKTEEALLAEVVRTLCRIGFSPTRENMKDLVKEYVNEHNIANPFKDNRPGKDWVRLFMGRNNLSMKKANMISSARKSATANPFIIHDFFDVLEEIMKEKKLKPEQIWNCDESGFPHDPQRCKVVSAKGETAYKLTCGSGRENTTTLAAVCASGRVLDPLIIFSGKNFQSTWRGKDVLPETLYGVSDNGWMTTDIFAAWFESFSKQVKGRPLLLILDGHLTHVSVKIIEKALKEDITILKFPPHVTDLLQPADVTCFGPLKRKWEKKLNEYVNVVGASKGISKATFVDLISSVWHEGLTPENVISGFRKTGIYPVDRTKFPQHRFDVRLVKSYDQWVQLGRPDDLMEELAMSVTTPQKVKDAAINNSPKNVDFVTEVNLNKEDFTPLPQSSASAKMTSSPMVHNCMCQNCIKLGEKPQPIPGKVWTPVWVPLEASTPKENRSFEEIALDKMKGPKKDKGEKRRKIHLKTKIISDEKLLEELKQQERDRKEKEEKKLANAKKRKTVKKQIEIEFESDEDEDEVTGSVSEAEIAIEEETEEEVMEESSEDEGGDTEDLKKLWKGLCPPTREEEILQKWFGAVYVKNSKQYLYVGKATKRFLDDEDGAITGIELDCLKPHVGTGTELESYAGGSSRDIDVFPIHDIIEGSLFVEPLKGNRWNVPTYRSLKEKFMRVVQLDRSHIFYSTMSS